ncbi:hypothetical protein M413DRAFT_29693 [Hebeloma cylindrosporum]|uniref:Uncharacterized protein n=1 Tax=Hebeloma cylindrosporum TaxID=76867 RepID=A0A0C3C4H5_HEBCY|nr:hypothetical protein M413DRAFT_29693 [Hebeloma cylindrosporum h7]
MTCMTFQVFNHDDFEVVRVVNLFGGCEELRHIKNKEIAAVTPNNPDELDQLSMLERKVMADGGYGAVHPV